MATGGIMQRSAWRIVAGISVLLALAGVVLPLLPTTPFALLAFWSASRSSPALARWLREHRTLGPVLAAWHDSGAVPRSAKWLACLMLLLSGLIMAASGVPPWGLAIFSVFALGVAGFVLSRPSSAGS